MNPYDTDELEVTDITEHEKYSKIADAISNLSNSEASKVNIPVKAHSGVIALAVSDNGKGFDPLKKPEGIGISNMINRAESFNGEIEIESSKGKGCKTIISIPY